MQTQGNTRESALDLFRLDGKTAIVTGGGRGLGKYMAEALVDAGASVVLCSRKRDACEETRKDMEDRGGKAVAMGCDVTDPEQVNEVVEETIKSFGAVDILINNSGATWGAPTLEMPLEAFEKVVDANLRGTFLTSQAILKKMVDRGEGGKVVNVASVSGLLGGRPDFVNTVGYHASKGGVISMTRDLATTFAQHGINVNAIAPGWFPTKMSRGVMEQFEERMLEGIPLHRFGSPDDIRGIALLLTSSAGAYMTGQTVVVDGGATAW